MKHLLSFGQKTARAQLLSVVFLSFISSFVFASQQEEEVFPGDMQPVVSEQKVVVALDDTLFSQEKDAYENDEQQLKEEHEESKQQETEQKKQVEEMRYIDEEDASILPGTQSTFDIPAKRAAVKRLVLKGSAHIKNQSIEQALSDISHSSEFINGELYLFVYDQSGVCLAHGQENGLIWKHLYDFKDQFGVYVVRAIIEQAKKGPGWVTYQWRGATKTSFVTLVEKDETTYIVGAGYYPHSKADIVVSIVKGAVALFNLVVIEQGHAVEEALSSYSYPMGRFIYGDLYIFGSDFKGTNVAHGDNPALIGTNSYHYQDASGKFVVQDTIKALEKVELGQGIWIEYLSKGAQKRSYVEKVVDKGGKSYFISCGYYPEIGRKDVLNLVRTGYKYAKTHGMTQAAEAITKRRKELVKGDLYLFIYSMEGKVIAHGGNRALVGLNHWNMRDGNETLFVQSLIEKAKEGGGWGNYKLKNSFQSIYVEKIDLGIEQFVIGCGVYPISKHETMLLLAKSGASYLQTHDLYDALGAFTEKSGKFIRGDLSLFVFDTQGICYVYADNYNLIWRKLITAVDDHKRPFVSIFINAAQRGPQLVSYTINGVDKIAYVEPVRKEGKTYIVGSSYYQ